MGMPPATPRELSSGGSIVKAVKEECQPLHSVKQENVDDPLNASSSPSDLDAKNDDASFVKEEEEQLCDAEQMEDAVGLASDPMTRFNKLDELLKQTKLYAEYILEKLLEESSNYSPGYDATLTEEEMWEKEQAKIVPLVTGAKLKPYQIEGVKWLISHWQIGVNGILADEIRIGKTIQSIAFLSHLKGNGLHGPYMIIASATTLTNWVDEISRLAPSLTCLIYYGDKVAREEMLTKVMTKTIGPDFPIIVTSYEMAIADAKLLAHYKWKYVVFDEGHELKNLECELLLELTPLPIGNGLLLTRTPFQNDLAELWSVLNFVFPEISVSHHEFESWFDFTGKRGEEQIEETTINRRAFVVSKLHAILDPFILRQMEKPVENTPPRTKGATCSNTKAVKNKDAVNLSKGHTVRDGARSGGQSSQEAAAEAAYENDGEGSPNLPSTQLGPEGNHKAKRPRTDDAVLSLLGEIKSTFQASLKPAEPVQVPKATSPREILEALKQIPDLTSADFLRAYSSLIRDDRQFESLMVLPAGMRKDWLLVETGKK
ncbi:ATP-dependent DNA helicase DDM1-like [Lolium perenne]|uniref:ATP-dependent DNA helicase DDM1-like n=1 Tax=Lolium perenne TaxID=4522 RepID=UPI0021EA2BBF|nr:ATP-dependent DNA helicase DDM1-like [Lolium perenne]